jgi:hypothetical protein
MMTSENPQNLKALVFGASGITGWAIAHTSLSYPTTTTFSRVIGLTNRPLSTKDSYLPPDPRLSLHSGVDLSGDENTISDSLSKINGVSEVTHVYFAGRKFAQFTRLSLNTKTSVHSPWLGSEPE